MKKCIDCNFEMVEDCEIQGEHPFILGADGESDIFVYVPTGEKTTLLGLTVDAINKLKLKSRLCPKCGKVELYVDMKGET